MASTRLRALVLLGLLAACDDATSSSAKPDAGTPSGGDPTDPTPDELASGGSCPAATGAATEHSGTVSADETWAAGAHVVTSSLDIRAKVTIEPCAHVVVKSGASIVVGSTSDAGSLVAHGTSDVSGGTRDIRPVVFDAEDASSGWGQLVVNAKGTADLSVAAILNAGAGANGERGALLVYGVAGGTNDGDVTKSVTVDRVLVDKSKSYGVNLYAWGAFADGSQKLWIRGGGSADYPSAVKLEAGVASTLPEKLVASGNVKDEILVQSSKTFLRADTFVERGVPYRVKGLLYVQGSKDGAPTKLTIEPGVTIGFDTASGSGMKIGSSDTNMGILEAVGTADKPIVFTSGKDTKAPGDWANLSFHRTPTTGSKIDHARFEYAGGASQTSSFGCGPKTNDAAVIIEGSGADEKGPDTAWITNTTFENIAGTTVIVSGWVSDNGPDFSATNTFGGGVPACHVSKPRRSGAGDVCDGGRDVCW